MPSAKNVAEYFLSLSSPDLGDYISNLKLQKLLYYAQGYHLALYDSPLFPEEILAWEHGPVVQTLYYEYRSNGSAAIEPPCEVNTENFNKDQLDLIEEVYEVMGQFSAWKLRNMTHAESPWIDTPRNSVITHERLQEYFSTQVN